MGNTEAKTTNYGYRIVKVAPDSPAKKAGLIEFLDYIIDISSPDEQIPFSGNYGDFFKIVQNCEDKQATLKVYNILSRKIRTVIIIPSKKWENADSLLGALVRYEEFATAHERALRIAAVHPNSPAEAAELQAENDYILGSPQYLYTDLNELANFIEMTQENDTIKSLELYLYNAQTNSVRSTLIIPNKNWGGQGYLGCEFALGILNYLPEFEDKAPILKETWNNHSLEHVERLDEDDTPGLKTSKNIAEDGKKLTKFEENAPRSSQETHETEHISKEENKEEKMPEFKLRSPSKDELDLSRSYSHNEHDRLAKPSSIDLSHELINQRMKQLNSGQKPKITAKPVPRPPIKSGKTLVNPFHDPKSSSNPQSEGNQSYLNSFDNIGSIDDLPHTQSHEKVTSSPNQIEKAQPEHEKHTTAPKEIIPELQHPVHNKDHSSTEKSHLINEEKKQEEMPKVELTKKDILNNGEQVKESMNKSPKVSPKRLGSKDELANNGLNIKENRKTSVGSGAGDREGIKTNIEYNYFSKKLNGDYKIQSRNLFCIEELEQVG